MTRKPFHVPRFRNRLSENRRYSKIHSNLPSRSKQKIQPCALCCSTKIMQTPPSAVHTKKIIADSVHKVNQHIYCFLANSFKVNFSRAFRINSNHVDIYFFARCRYNPCSSFSIRTV
ncbi:hypothetical protein CEXT_643461 [Caerostris extrusa]|uniref:Uncharacterized protein n=1 Tax=Caerostris extrusa TaxID=172846 RepID=A0AAV4RHM2_CAEEX|nr:hypothetical protein CEXT_643461 [Caerostris extrusa]